MKSYRQINERDRRKIAKLKSYKLSISEIARRTGFNKSTISREIKRNGNGLVKVDRERLLNYFRSIGDFSYHPKGKDYVSYDRKTAQWSAKHRRAQASRRQRISIDLQNWIITKIESGWSPQQIAGRTRINGRSVSHEYIYKLIIKDKRSGGSLYRMLKRFGKRKQRLGKREYQKSILPGRVPINARPAFIEKRNRLGDLEGDIIVGRKQSGYIVSVIDRRSRLVVLELIKTRKANEVEEALLRAIKQMPKAHTITLDNAKEHSCHISITNKLGIKVYFTDPYSSFQKGSIENANGLVRYYLPKTTDFSTLKGATVKAIEKKLNTRPRKVLNYLTAEEASKKLT